LKRTQIYLPEPETKELKVMAAKQNISMAELIRRLIKKGMEIKQA
jgi:hypothetical protein